MVGDAEVVGMEKKKFKSVVAEREANGRREENVEARRTR